MKSTVSVLIITKNSQDTISDTLNSVIDFANDIVIVDSNSKDQTLKIVNKICKEKKVCKILVKEFDDIGKQRAYGLIDCKGDWVLVLDSDEVVSTKLKNEIKQVLSATTFKNVTAYIIPFQNHYMGTALNHGGENYKMVRFFKKGFFEIKPSRVHNYFKIKSGVTSKFMGKIYHYSYRSISQMFRKFQDYARLEAQIKFERGERSGFRKLFLYPPHMFFARFIKDNGYKDGLFRLPLDIGFAYMEFLTYFLLFFKKK